MLNHSNVIFHLVHLVAQEMEGKRNRKMQFLLAGLFLLEFRFITKEQARMIMGGGTPLTENYAGVRISDAVKNEYIQRRESPDGTILLELTIKGRRALLNSLKKWLMEYDQKTGKPGVDPNIVDMLSDYRSDSPENIHGRCVNDTIITLCLNLKDSGDTFYREYDIIKKEERDFTGYPQGTVVADIYSENKAGQKICIEIDRETEHLTGRSSLIGKIERYSRYYQPDHTDLFFVFSREIERRGEDGLTEAAELLKKSKYACTVRELKLFLMFYRESGHKADSLDEFTQWRLGYANQLGKSTIFDDGTKLLNAVSLLKRNGSLEEGSLEGTIECAFSLLQKDIPNEKNGKEIAYKSIKKKRAALYERMIQPESVSLLSGCGIMQGMTITCCHSRNLEDVYQSVYMTDRTYQCLPDILSNLGITEQNEKLKMRPGIYPIWEDGSGRNPFLCLRNVFTAGDLMFAIENISDDIGGFFRVQQYLSLPAGHRKGLLLIAIVEDDCITANGQMLDTIFYREVTQGPNPNAYVPITQGLLNYTYALEQAQNSFLEINGYSGTSSRELPFLMDRTQDFIVVTKTQFERAKKEWVMPWTPGQGAVKFFRRRVIQGEKLPSLSIYQMGEAKYLYK